MQEVKSFTAQSERSALRAAAQGEELSPREKLLTMVGLGALCWLPIIAAVVWLG